MKNHQEASDLTNTIHISARRYEESPFIERTNSPDMIRGVYAGRYFPIYMGEDPLQKYWTLRRKALIFDVPEKPVEISGPDAVPFLEKILSRKIASLKEGRGLYAIACTPQGGVFMDGILFKLGTDRYWYVQADGAFETWLLAFSEGFDITVSDPRSRVLQIQGPASIDIMRVASNGSITEDMRYFQSGFFNVGGQQLYVSRTGFTGEAGFEIYCDGETTDHLALWDHLHNAGQPFGMEFSSTRAMTIRRIEAGILGNLTDMDTTMTPFEAGLKPFIDMDKNDFVGKAALEGRDQRTLLLGITCHSETPVAGSEIIADEQVVGHVTAGVPSPTLGCGIGYVRFVSADSWVGRTLVLRLPDQATHTCEIVRLPFFDANKEIARGINRDIPD